MSPTPGRGVLRVLFVTSGTKGHQEILALLRAAKHIEVAGPVSVADAERSPIRPNAIVLDLGQNRLMTRNLAALAAPAAGRAATPLVVLGEHDTHEATVHALRHGAHDYLCRNRLTPAILSASIWSAATHITNQNGGALQRMPAIDDQLVETEATVRALFEHASQGIMMADIAGKIVQANAMVEELFGYRRKELLGRTIETLLPQRFRSAHVQYRAEYTSAPRPRPMGLSGELSGLRKDGSEFPVEISLSHIVTQGGGLVVAFVSDITIRKHAESALRESEARFQAFMDNSPALAFIKDQEGRVVWTNRAYERIFNLNPERYFGKTVFDLWSPEVAKTLRMHDVQTLAANCAQEFLETLPTASGEDRQFISFKFAFPGGLEQRMLGGMLIDVTERHRAEEQMRVALIEKTVLLKEVHHRVKNNLAVVSSLLAMQAATAGDAAALALCDSQRRLESMALVHEYLYASSQLDRVNFQEYTNKLANEIAYAFDLPGRGLRLLVEADAVELGLDLAIPCGLILNELISNSLKYAFTDSRHGQVTVQVQTLPQSRLLLSVSDDGVGLPPDFDWRNADSLGLRIVQLLTKQLDATIELIGGAGTRFELVIPKGDVQ